MKNLLVGGVAFVAALVLVGVWFALVVLYTAACLLVLICCSSEKRRRSVRRVHCRGVDALGDLVRSTWPLSMTMKPRPRRSRA